MTEVERLKSESGGAQSNEPSLYESLLKEIHAAQHVPVSSLHPRGSVFFSEGQQARGIYMLRAGRAKVSVSSAAGKVLLLKIVRGGDLLGLNATLRNSNYEATVQTLEPCVIDFISGFDLRQLLTRSDSVRLAVTAALSQELTETFELVRYLTLARSTTEKLSRLLIKWCDEVYDSGRQEIRINPGLTQEEIAQMIGTSRETVTRLFAEFRRKQIVSPAGNSIIVRNREALAILACGEEAVSSESVC